MTTATIGGPEVGSPGVPIGVVALTGTVGSAEGAAVTDAGAEAGAVLVGVCVGTTAVAGGVLAPAGAHPVGATRA